MAIDADDLQDIMRTFIQYRDKITKEHKVGGKPRSNTLSENSANTKPMNQRQLALVGNSLNLKRGFAPEPNSDLTLKEYFFDKLASKS